MSDIIPSVSVCIFTYNHEKYIHQCIESVLMQRTKFSFELIIGEDYSTDSTRVICEEYNSRYKEIILIDRGKNVGMCENVFKTIMQARGKYIAILDGDDYWIHPLKLQKQYDYLQNNEKKNLVFHQTIVINEIKKSIDLFVKEEKSLYTLFDIISSWTMATGSMFFRNNEMEYPPFLSHTHNFDLAIQMIMNRKNNEIGYLEDIMSVYRINEGSNTNNPEYNILKTWERHKQLFDEYNEYTKGIYSDFLMKKIMETNENIKKHNAFNIRKRIRKYFKMLISKKGYHLIIKKA